MSRAVGSPALPLCVGTSRGRGLERFPFFSLASSQLQAPEWECSRVWCCRSGAVWGPPPPSGPPLSCDFIPIQEHRCCHRSAPPFHPPCKPPGSRARPCTRSPLALGCPGEMLVLSWPPPVLQAPAASQHRELGPPVLLLPKSWPEGQNYNGKSPLQRSLIACVSFPLS